MGKIRDFFFGPEETDAKFSSYTPVLDGVPVTTVDQHIRYLFNGTASVSREEALGIPAVLRGRNLIADSIATLPLVTYKGNNEVVANELLRQIDPYGVTNLVTLSKTLEDLLFESVSFWVIDEFGYNGYPTKAHHVNVKNVAVNPPVNAKPTALYSGVHPEGSYWIDGQQVDARYVIRFDSPNPALLKSMGRIIRRAIATAATSEMYARNPMPKLLFTPKSDADPDPDETRTAIQNFADTASDSPYSYVGAALDARPLEMMSPADLQQVEIEKNIERGVANALGLDPEDLGISTTSRTYQNATDRRKDRINDLLAVFMQAIEQRLSMGDVTPRGYFVKFNLDDYMKADPKTRAEVQQIYVGMGVLTVDEIRQREGLPPLTDEQKKSLVKPAPATALEASDKVILTLDSEEDLNLAFEGAQFASESVNTNSRTVVALAVPYGQAARSGGRKWMFEKGSLYYSDLKRVKLLRDHDNTQAVGYAIDAQDTDEGLVVTFKVAPGPAGDKALADFIAGTHDGVSIGVNFEESDFYTDPKYPGVNVVKKAHLREVSQTAMPAFDDSRSISVTAHRDGVNMSDNTPAVTNDGAENDKKFSLEDFAKMQALFGANNAPQKPAVVQDDTNVPPREEPKDNTNEGSKLEFVSEPPIYRFDGTGEHEFSTDVINAMQNRDAEAMGRVNKFLKAEFAVSTTNAAALNPVKQRPDMYVDQLQYEYPIFNTIYRGSLEDNTAFTFPKYSTSSGLVSDHTEGTEPSLGAMAFTNQTVTPTALSGKIEINREAWDQGGNPSLSNAIMTQMRRAWYEGLEQSAAAFLDGLTLTGLETTITPATVDSALYKEVTRATAKLKYSRGGYRLTDFLAHEDLFVNLMTAEDADDRPLFPMINPVNANGGATERMGLTINGLNLKNAWALGASGSVAENSYLLTPEDVAAWASAPQFLEFNIQVKSVYLGIWGYKAFAVSRNEGIRRFIYDPSAS